MGKFGQKFLCSECNCKFFDLGRPNPVCPKCGTEARKMTGRQVSRIEVPKAGVKREVTEETLPLEAEGDIDIDDNLWDSIDEGEEETDAS